MAFTLSNLLQAMYKELGQLKLRRATGGSTTTVVDTTLSGLLTDETPKDGTMFVVRDAGGASAAPEGEFARISNYVDSTTTFTVDSTLGAAVASGDTYGWASSRYPLDLMVQMANDGLRALGDMPLIDTTTLDSAAQQTEYTYALAWKRTEPFRVDIQGITNDSNNNQWRRTDDWHYVPAAAGTTALLVFNFQPVSGRDIRIWYKGVHGLLNAFSDPVNEGIDPELAVIMGSLKALEFANSKSQGTDTFILQKINKLENKLAQREATTPLPRHKKRSKILILGQDSSVKDYFTYPLAP